MKTKLCIFCKSSFRLPMISDKWGFDEKRICLSCKEHRKLIAVLIDCFKNNNLGHGKTSLNYWVRELNSLDI